MAKMSYIVGVGLLILLSAQLLLAAPDVPRQDPLPSFFSPAAQEGELWLDAPETQGRYTIRLMARMGMGDPASYPYRFLTEEYPIGRARFSRLLPTSQQAIANRLNPWLALGKGIGPPPDYQQTYYLIAPQGRYSSQGEWIWQTIERHAQGQVFLGHMATLYQGQDEYQAVSVQEVLTYSPDPANPLAPLLAVRDRWEAAHPGATFSIEVLLFERSTSSGQKWLELYLFYQDQPALRCELDPVYNPGTTCFIVDDPANGTILTFRITQPLTPAQIDRFDVMSSNELHEAGLFSARAPDDSEFLCDISRRECSYWRGPPAVVAAGGDLARDTCSFLASLFKGC